MLLHSSLEEQGGMVKHLCCDICDKLCNCNNNCSDFQHPYFEFVLSDVSTSSDESDCFDFEDLTI